MSSEAERAHERSGHVCDSGAEPNCGYNPCIVHRMSSDDVTIFICPVCEAVIEGDQPCPNGPHDHEDSP